MIIRQDARPEARSVAFVARRKGAAELHLRKTEAVAQLVGCVGQAFKFFAPPWIEQLELAAACGKRRKRDSYKPHHCGPIPRSRKQFADGLQKHRIEVGWFGKRMASRNRSEISVSQCQSYRQRMQPRIAQPLCCFLAKVAER